MTQTELNLLFKKCYKSNIPQLIHLTESKEAAQEVYQEAFYVFLKKWKQGAIQNQQNLCGYIFRVAKNKWLENKRKSKEISWDSILMPNETLTDDFDQLEVAENVLEQKKRAQLILAAMKELGDNCRKLLMETIVYKVSLKKLQEELGYASYNAVKVAKHQCKKSLIRKYWKLEGEKNE